MVAIAVFGTRAVEQQGHIVVFLVVVVLLQFRQHAAVHKPRADYEERDVYDMANDGGIGHDVYGRAVQENVVVLLLQGFHHRHQAGRIEQFRGVGRYFADWQEVKVGHIAVLIVGIGVCVERMPHDEMLKGVFLTAEIVSKARRGLVYKLRKRATAQVEVDADDAAAPDGKRCPKVGGDERLARTRVERGEHDHLAALFHPCHIFEVRAHHAVCLVCDVAAMQLHHKVVFLFQLFSLRCPPQRQFAHVRDREILEVFAPAHLRVAHFLDDEISGGQSHSYGESKENEAFFIWKCRCGAAPRRGDKLRVVSGERLAQLVFLPLLQQEEI